MFAFVKCCVGLARRCAGGSPWAWMRSVRSRVGGRAGGCVDGGGFAELAVLASHRKATTALGTS